METRASKRRNAQRMHVQNEKVPGSGMQIQVTTVSGSITGTTMSLTVDPKLSVSDLKLLVQDMSVTTPDQRGPTRRVSKKGVTFEYSRVFLDGHELVDDDSILETCGVKEDSAISFAIGKTLGNKLRRAMRQIGEDFSAVDDSEILAAVMQQLKGRMLAHDSKGGVLLDGLYDIFDTDFSDFEGVHEGYLTPRNEKGENQDYIRWLVEEKVEGSFPFKTYFGIPVYTRLYGRQVQNFVGQPHPRSLIAATADPNLSSVASTGYFGGSTGRIMACTAHFAGEEGTAVHLRVGAQQVGRTIVSKKREDFALIAHGR